MFKKIVLFILIYPAPVLWAFFSSGLLFLGIILTFAKPNPLILAGTSSVYGFVNAWFMHSFFLNLEREK